MVNVKTDFASETPGPNYTSVVVANSGVVYLWILANSFDTCLKKSCFLDSSKVSSVKSLFKNVKERSEAQLYCSVLFLLLLLSLRNL